MPAALAKWKAANLKIEPTENPNEVYLVAPEGIRVEVYGEPALPTDVSMNHIHYNASDIPESGPGTSRPSVPTPAGGRAWRAWQAADDRSRRHAGREPVVLGGTNPTPTKGERSTTSASTYTNLEELVSSLDAKGIKIEAPIRQVPNTKVKVAFLTDPWGTYIELTEGLAMP